MVDLDLRAHVDTAGGLVENEDVRIGVDPLADDHLLLVAAGELGRHLVQGRGLDPQGLHVLLAGLLDPRLVQEGSVGEALHVGQDQVGPHVQGQHQALALAVLGQEGDLVLDGILGGADMYLLALDVDLAAVHLVGAEDGAHGLGPAGAHQAGKAGDLAGMGLEAHVVEDAELIEVLRLQPHVALDAELLGIEVIQRPAHHGGDQGVLRHVGDVLGDDVLAVPHDSDPVAQLKELFQFMRDEQDRHALGLQAPDGGHQLLDLLLAQGGGRLVHDDQLGIQRHSLGDLHHLLLAGAQLAAFHFDVDLGVAQGRQCLLGLLVHSGVVQKAVLLDGASHENVICDRQLLDDVQLLVHAGDARLAGLDGVVEDHLLAVHVDLPLLRSVNAGEHLDQGGLAGAILADQAVDLSRPDANRHIFQCDDTRKTFGNVLQFDNVLTHGITSFLFPDFSGSRRLRGAEREYGGRGPAAIFRSFRC